jgi:hypothetical protein
VGPESLQRVFEAQMARPYFPVNLNEMSAAREFKEVTGGDTFVLRDTRITARWLNHPQGCLGFRFDTPAGTIVYATDNEPGVQQFDRDLLDLARDADVLVCDAQYTPQQMETRKGWGHSNWLDCVRLAQGAGVKNLVLFHHDPDSSDESVDRILCEARAHFRNAWLASEGMVLTLADRQVEVAIPAECIALPNENKFQARVAGISQNGSAFEEQAQIGELGLRVARVYLHSAPQVQSGIQVFLEGVTAGRNGNRTSLSGHVVRVNPAENGLVGVEVLFT